MQIALRRDATHRANLAEKNNSSSCSKGPLGFLVQRVPKTSEVHLQLWRFVQHVL